MAFFTAIRVNERPTGDDCRECGRDRCVDEGPTGRRRGRGARLQRSRWGGERLVSQAPQLERHVGAARPVGRQALIARQRAHFEDLEAGLPQLPGHSPGRGSPLRRPLAGWFSAADAHLLAGALSQASDRVRERCRDPIGRDPLRRRVAIIEGVDVGVREVLQDADHGPRGRGDRFTDRAEVGRARELAERRREPGPAVDDQLQDDSARLRIRTRLAVGFVVADSDACLLEPSGRTTGGEMCARSRATRTPSCGRSPAADTPRTGAATAVWATPTATPDPSQRLA